MNDRFLPGPGDWGGYATDPRAPNYRGDHPEETTEPCEGLEWADNYLQAISYYTERFYDSRKNGDLGGVLSAVVHISEAAKFMRSQMKC